MNIAEQLTLFFDTIRESQTNSGLSPEQALERINRSRRRVAVKTRFYDVRDSVTATGGEKYFTLLDTFIDLQAARDCATRNERPITIKSLAAWASITAEGGGRGIEGGGWGMLHGNTFYIYPTAVAGDVFVWWGAALPPELSDITGPDAYLNSTQAEVAVLDAAITALEDLGESPGPVLIANFTELAREIKMRGKPRGPRLENAPEG